MGSISFWDRKPWSLLRKYAYQICCIVSMIFTLALVIIYDSCGMSMLPYNMTFNLGADVISLGVCTVLLFSFIRDEDEHNRYTRTFVLLISATSSVLFSDACCWVLDGRPELRIYNIIANTMNFINAALLIFFLWRYLFTALKPAGKLVHMANKLMLIILIPEIISCFVNLFYPLYFIVDDNGVYSRLPAFPISQIYPGVCFLAAVTTIIISKEPFRERAVMSIFILIPVANQIITGYRYGFSTQYPAMLISIVLVYGVLVAKREKKLISTEKELYESKVAIMTSQVQPHFVYNALTSIAMMCTIDPKTAQQATITFAKYLRTNMDSLKQTAPVPFEQELEHLKKYLYIEKLRFEDKLNIEYDIRVTDFLIPQLSVQPIVENAVKHGVGMKKKGGTVTIATRETDTEYLVIISDDGVGFDTTAEKKDDGRSHIGMENTRTRLKEMCGGGIKIDSIKNEGTTVTIILPKEGQKNEDTVS
ncbi:MAG: histidine kinase [Oscillospiraceae bacterium]|nr:histidine kinase [Oscillospiraceae bacterium]